MVKSCTVIPSGTTTKAALLMIGLVGLCQVNCAETIRESSGIETLRRSPSPPHEPEWFLEPAVHESAIKHANDPASNDFDVPTLIANEDSSVSSNSSNSEIGFYGSGLTSKFDDSPRRLYDAIMTRMSHLSNLTDIFVQDEALGLEDVAYASKNESDEESDTENNSDAIPSSSYDGSNIKTRGGSKESLRTPKSESKAPADFKNVAVDDNACITGDLVSFDIGINDVPCSMFHSSFSANSIVDLLQQSDIEQVSPSFNRSKMRSASPFTRRSRASSIELDLATAACSAASSLTNINNTHQQGTSGPENQIREELMQLITQDSIFPLNLIDNYSSNQLYTVCDNVGTYILNHLSQQAAKMPTTPSTELAYNLLEQLGRVFTLVITTLSPDERLEYDEIILKSLEVTISDVILEYDSFRIVRDALILLMMDFPDIFSDDFLRKQAVYDILQKIVVRSSTLKQFDTIDYIRLLSNLSNIFDLQQYFNVKFDIPERKLSEEFYLPLKEANLPSENGDEDENGLRVIAKSVKRSTKKTLRKKTRKESFVSATTNNTRLIKKSTDYSKTITAQVMRILRFIHQFGWLNRAVLIRAVFIAIILQIFVFRK